MGNASIGELAAWAREDAARFLADFTAKERKARADLARKKHEANVAAVAPQWAERRRELAIKALLAEVGDGPPTAEHKASIDRILEGAK
jgi:HEPN domain-containing protein